MRTIMDQPYPSSYSLSDAATRYVASIQKANGDGYNGSLGLGLAVWSACQTEGDTPVCEFMWGPGAKASGLKTIATPCVSFVFSNFVFREREKRERRERERRERERERERERRKKLQENSLLFPNSLSFGKNKQTTSSPSGVKLEECALYFDGTVVTSPSCWDGANVFGPVGKTVVKAKYPSQQIQVINMTVFAVDESPVPGSDVAAAGGRFQVKYTHVQ